MQNTRMTFFKPAELSSNSIPCRPHGAAFASGFSAPKQLWVALITSVLLASQNKRDCRIGCENQDVCEITKMPL